MPLSFSDYLSHAHRLSNRVSAFKLAPNKIINGKDLGFMADINKI